jgi:hypothetical protein
MMWRVGPDHEENDVTGKRRLSGRLEKDVDFSAIRELAGGYASRLNVITSLWPVALASSRS